jgi:hypothetical protein
MHAGVSQNSHTVTKQFTGFAVVGGLQSSGERTATAGRTTEPYPTRSIASSRVHRSGAVPESFANHWSDFRYRFPQLRSARALRYDQAAASARSHTQESDLIDLGSIYSYPNLPKNAEILSGLFHFGVYVDCMCPEATRLGGRGGESISKNYAQPDIRQHH